MSKETNENLKKSLYLFHGENSYDSQQKVTFWKKHFSDKHGPDALEIIDGSKLDLPNFLTNIESPPFLSEKRLVIVKGFLSQKSSEKHKDKMKAVATSLKKKTDECILVFHENKSADKRTSLYKKLKQVATVEEFKTPEGNELSNWILKKSKEENLKIDFPTANFLAQYCGESLWTISNEIKKLKTFADTKPVNKEMIQSLCTPSIHASIFKLTDQLSQKSLQQSLKTVEELADSGEDLIRVFFMIIRHFRILIQVKEMNEDGESRQTIIKKLRQHPFVIQKTTQQARNFENPQLKEIYQELLDIDHKSKTGKIKTYGKDNSEFKLAIEQFIINCCK